MDAVRIILLLMLTLLVCESCKDFKSNYLEPTVKVIACEEPGTRKVLIYKTTNTFPLHKGGWNFTTVEGKRVLSTSNCHHVSEE